MKNNIFQKPNLENDRNELDQSKKGTIDFNKLFYRPVSSEKLKKEEENVIRVLPSKNPNASWHLRAAKHFIRHADKVESFICMKETYGEDCPACEEYEKAKAKKDQESIMKWKPKRFGVFNVIDRMKEEDGPKIYEAPVRAVWQKIVSLVVGQGRMSNIFDEYDSKGNRIKEGRDFLISFNANAHPQDMYAVIPTDPSPLTDDEEQLKEWVDNMQDLILESLYPPIEYEEARIKCFGTQEERDALRQEKANKIKEAQEKDEAETEKKKEEKKTESAYERAKRARERNLKNTEEETTEEENAESNDDNETNEAGENSDDDIVSSIQATVQRIKRENKKK